MSKNSIGRTSNQPRLAIAICNKCVPPSARVREVTGHYESKRFIWNRELVQSMDGKNSLCFSDDQLFALLLTPAFSKLGSHNMRRLNEKDSWVDVWKFVSAQIVKLYRH